MRTVRAHVEFRFRQAPWWLAPLLGACTGPVADPPDPADPLGNVGFGAALSDQVSKNDGYGGGLVTARAVGFPTHGAVSGSRTVDGASIEVEDAFEIASVTKTVTATTTLLLVEQGALELDQPFVEILPEWREGLIVIGGSDLTGKITIRQLLQHTSGLPDYWTDPPFVQPGTNEFLKQFLADTEHFWTPDEILEYVPGLTPICRPGACWHYADTNYVLLGLIIERTTGDSLHDVMREQIFDPLGMADTWMSFREDRPLPASHRYEGHWDMTDKTNQSADWAGGGLVSTGGDLAAFLIALEGGEIYAQPSTLESMLTLTETGEKDLSYGLGVFSVALDDGTELWGHDGYGNSFAYIKTGEERIVFTGTLNQTENDWWPVISPAL